MHIRHVVPFLLLFAWQVAPDPGLQDRPSRLKLWLGGGGTSFDLGEVTSCDGSRYMDRESWSGWGVQADAWPAPSQRVSVSVASVERKTQLAGMVAWEASFAGVGAGWSSGPARVGYEGLSAYLRLGSLDRAHLRGELRSPTPLPGLAGWARVGLASNMGRRRGGSFYVGAAAVKACPQVPCPTPSPPAVTDKLGFFADVDVAVGSTVVLFARGHLASGARGFGLGMALRLVR